MTERQGEACVQGNRSILACPSAVKGKSASLSASALAGVGPAPCTLSIPNPPTIEAPSCERRQDETLSPSSSHAQYRDGQLLHAFLLCASFPNISLKPLQERPRNSFRFHFLDVVIIKKRTCIGVRGRKGRRSCLWHREANLFYRRGRNGRGG